MSDFKLFADAVNAQYNLMGNQDLWLSTVPKDVIYDAYLNAFPEGTNEIYKERREYDCNCCASFIKNLGRTVNLKDGVIYTVWGNLDNLPHPFNVVAKALDKLVKSYEVGNLYYTDEAQYGVQFNLAPNPDNELQPIRWNHFWAKTGVPHITTPTFVSEVTNKIGVIQRSLLEIKDDALETVLMLASSGSIYRGSEFVNLLEAFKQAKEAIKARSAYELKLLVKEHHREWPAIKNTSIGTLLIDLSEGRDLEAAVKAFETIVAPQNYKRPTALITKPMIEAAIKELDTLGLRDAINRRCATINDISVNNVLWASASAQTVMKDSLLEGLLAAPAATRITRDIPVVNISIEKFIANVLPTAVSMNLLFEPKLKNKLVNLIAPNLDAESKLFAWDNPYSLSYVGNLTDAITERVKQAGGNTDAPLGVSLAWRNPDDLDIHCRPPKGDTIYHGDKQGILDVDMNAFGVKDDFNPVENLSFKNPQQGIYTISVNNYNKRSNDRVGFTLQVRLNGETFEFTHPTDLKEGSIQRMLEINTVDNSIKILHPKLIAGVTTKEPLWGIKLNEEIPVQTVMLSPNFWDGQSVGNKHFLFMLEGCKNPDKSRGIYNEFLRKELQPHRKVFEVLGGTTLCEPTDNQLAGIGFSSTIRTTFKVNVTERGSNRLTHYLVTV